MIKHFKYQTKKGGASIYVTIFIALIISIVTLSFARLAISELSKSGDYDLNQSAYDSALAGVEDARLTISSCLQTGKTLDQCGITSTNLDDCNAFLKSPYIDRDEVDGAVFIEENSNQSGETTSQAYTCVVLNSNLPDYLGQISSDYRVRLVPLKSDNLNGVDNVVLSWYENSETQCPSGNCDGKFGSKENAPVPPVLAVSVIQAGSDFTRDSFNDTRNGKFGSVVLYPNGNIGNDVSMAEVSAGELVSAFDKGSGTNQAKIIGCHSTDTYACSVRIKLPSASRHKDTTYLVVAMPYDNTSSAFKVTLNDSSNSVINFRDAQIAVDSTGRANDVYRRIEARIDPVDIYYPYSLYGVELASAYGSEGGMDKDFWVTRNCWMSKGGSVSSCDNSGTSYPN
ncbi:hypothetical protein IJI91_03025 [Candidatus Saccharibacteria bacterium]|nr:hypothetical protein [Candidatus Saccharibacteria bacterium]